MQCRGISNEILRKKGGPHRENSFTKLHLYEIHIIKSQIDLGVLLSLKHQSIQIHSFISIKTLGYRNAGSKQNHLNSYSYIVQTS